MDEGTCIVIALAICLALLANLYFVIDRLGNRVLTLAAQARTREQNDIINHERLARTLNELVDETTVLTEALKSERILRSHTEVAERVATKKAAREAAVDPPTPSADHRRAIEITGASAAAAQLSERDPSDDADTRVLSRSDLQAATRPAVRLTPTRVSAHSAARGQSR